MKKFITYISMQPKSTFACVKYDPVDNDEFVCDRSVYFPVSILVESYSEPGDEIEVLCMMEEDNADVRDNYETLKRELDAIAVERSIKLSLKEIAVSKDENVSGHLFTFSSLIENIDDGDVLHVCATYGTKPIPIIEMMAINYAYMIMKDVTIRTVAYGKINRKNGQISGACIYDITSLFSMMQLVNNLGSQNITNAAEVIRSVLGVEE